MNLTSANIFTSCNTILPATTFSSGHSPAFTGVPSAPIKHEGENYMEYLYEVFVVTKDKKFLINGEVVVAANEEEAKFDLQVTEKIRAASLRLDDVTVIVRSISKVKVNEVK